MEQSLLPDLTDKQRTILRFIAQRIRDNNQAPTIQEICDAFGYSSVSTAHQVLTALEKKGYIERTRYESRSIRLLVKVSLPENPYGAPGRTM